MTEQSQVSLFPRQFRGASSLKVLGRARDLRTNTQVIYAQATISDYLDLVGSDFDDFAIQRRREKHRAYDRMRQDIIGGALLPPITLAVKPERVSQLLPQIEQTNDYDEIAR